MQQTHGKKNNLKVQPLKKTASNLDNTALNRPLTAAEIKQYLPSFLNWPTHPPTRLQQKAIDQVISQHRKAEEASAQKQPPCNSTTNK